MPKDREPGPLEHDLHGRLVELDKGSGEADAARNQAEEPECDKVLGKVGLQDGLVEALRPEQEAPELAPEPAAGGRPVLRWAWRGVGHGVVREDPRIVQRAALPGRELDELLYVSIDDLPLVRRNGGPAVRPLDPLQNRVNGGVHLGLVVQQRGRRSRSDIPGRPSDGGVRQAQAAPPRAVLAGWVPGSPRPPPLGLRPLHPRRPNPKGTRSPDPPLDSAHRRSPPGLPTDPDDSQRAPRPLPNPLLSKKWAQLDRPTNVSR